MNKLNTFLLVATAAMALPGVAGASLTQGTGVAAQPSGQRDGAKKDKLVCKRDAGFDTGSHLRSTPKKCRKESEWKEREESAERFFRSVDDRSGVKDIDPPVM